MKKKSHLLILCKFLVERLSTKTFDCSLLILLISIKLMRFVSSFSNNVFIAKDSMNTLNVENNYNNKEEIAKYLYKNIKENSWICKNDGTIVLKAN